MHPAADARRRLVNRRSDARVVQPQGRRQPGDAGADDDDRVRVREPAKLLHATSSGMLAAASAAAPETADEIRAPH